MLVLLCVRACACASVCIHMTHALPNNLHDDTRRCPWRRGSTSWAGPSQPPRNCTLSFRPKLACLFSRCMKKQRKMAEARKKKLLEELEQEKRAEARKKERQEEAERNASLNEQEKMAEA